MSVSSSALDAVHPSFGQLAQSFRRKLLAENKSPNTVAAYCSALDRFAEFLIGRGMPTAIASISRERVEAFITYLLEHRKPATAHNRYRALSTFFAWLVDEGEITSSPMIRMKPPAIPEAPPPVLTDADMQKLLRACEGKDFRHGRHHAADHQGRVLLPRPGLGIQAFL